MHRVIPWVCGRREKQAEYLVPFINDRTNQIRLEPSTVDPGDRDDSGYQGDGRAALSLIVGAIGSAMSILLGGGPVIAGSKSKRATTIGVVACSELAGGPPTIYRR
jgi:hypothetical protein